MPGTSIGCGWRLWRSKRVRLSRPDLHSRQPHIRGSLLVRAPVTAQGFSYRDREDELEGVARRIKADRRRGVKPPLDRIALVVARPLPYLYLAREVFSGAGIPYEALDTLPLAAEPYAAAVDVVLEAVSANFTRRSMMALLRSPHFRFQGDGADVDRASVAALDIAMAEQRYLGGLDRLRTLVGYVDRRRTSRRACRARHRHDACAARRRQADGRSGRAVAIVPRGPRPGA